MPKIQIEIMLNNRTEMGKKVPRNLREDCLDFFPPPTVDWTRSSPVAAHNCATLSVVHVKEDVFLLRKYKETF
jgi:hypothetical protein